MQRLAVELNARVAALPRLTNPQSCPNVQAIAHSETHDIGKQELSSIVTVADFGVRTSWLMMDEQRRRADEPLPETDEGSIAESSGAAAPACCRQGLRRPIPPWRVLRDRRCSPPRNKWLFTKRRLRKTTGATSRVERVGLFPASHHSRPTPRASATRLM